MRRTRVESACRRSHADSCPARACEHALDDRCAVAAVTGVDAQGEARVGVPDKEIEKGDALSSADFYAAYRRGEFDTPFGMAWATYYEALLRSREDPRRPKSSGSARLYRRSPSRSPRSPEGAGVRRRCGVATSRSATRAASTPTGARRRLHERSAEHDSPAWTASMIRCLSLALASSDGALACPER
jgi:hypothetical protein